MPNFADSKLYGIKNKKYLSELLKINLDKLKEIDEHFSTPPFKKKQKNGKTRTLYNPHNEYKNILQRLNFYLQKINPPEYVLGGIKRRSYVMNAQIHLDNKYFLLLDLTDFFPSTSDYYVYGFFRYKLNMSTDIAKICTLLVTEPSLEDPERRHLPQGYSTSPYLSFLSYFDMYNEIEKIAHGKNINFSCYYDDLTFSSEEFIAKDFKKEIVAVIEKHGLRINKNKTRFHIKRDNGLKITGAIIRHNELKAPNSLQRQMDENFKALINLYQYNPSDTENLISLCNKTHGCMTAIKSIEGNREFSYISKKIKEIRNFANNKAK